ncbi:MAG: flagellar basal body-associated FliL family protein [Arcobacteraceae bacterium]
MAEENAVEEKKSGKNPMMLVLIILIVVLLLAVGGIGYFMYSKGLFSDQPANQAAPTTEKVSEKAKEDIGETFQAKIDSLVLNITDAKGRAKLMKLSFTMKSTEPTIEALVEANKAEMVDSVIRQISARSSEELLTVGGKAMLKEEMIDELNNILNDATDGQEDIKKNMILDIFFTSFVIK